jgi:hypothetical protein
MMFYKIKFFTDKSYRMEFCAYLIAVQLFIDNTHMMLLHHELKVSTL